MLVAKIDQAVVDRVTRTRFKDAAPATLQRQLLTPLTAVLTWAAARKWCDLPRFQRPATPRGRSRWASYEEADRLLAAGRAASLPAGAVPVAVGRTAWRSTGIALGRYRSRCGLGGVSQHQARQARRAGRGRPWRAAPPATGGDAGKPGATEERGRICLPLPEPAASPTPRGWAAATSRPLGRRH